MGMIAIGIRAAPKTVTYAIYDSEARNIVTIDEIVVPLALPVPAALKYIRSNLLDILREYKVELAGIRVTEPTAKSPSIDRIQIEGVIQEAFASSDLQGYYIGQISSISARLKIQRSQFKPLVTGELEFPIENWSRLGTAEREAALCAVGACNA